jgi:hypothetical protein
MKWNCDEIPCRHILRVLIEIGVNAIPQSIPPARPLDHAIPLLDESQIVNVKPERYPHYQKNELERLVAEMLQTGIIEESQSPFASPALLVKKKDGTCLCRLP